MEQKETFFQRYHEIKYNLEKAKLKKSGYNALQNYSYFQLADFLPKLLELEKEYGIIDFVTFENKTAKISLFDAYETDLKPKLVCDMPFPDIAAGENYLQLLGGAETYCRRYLYIAAFNIAESDLLDREKVGENVEFSQKEEKITTEEQNLELYQNLEESVGSLMNHMSVEEAKNIVVPFGIYINKTLGTIIKEQKQDAKNFLTWIVHNVIENGPYGNKIIAAANILLYNL